MVPSWVREVALGIEGIKWILFGPNGIRTIFLGPTTYEGQEKQPMLIVGAALGRTGTQTLKFALEQLGHKVFHGKQLTEPIWYKLWSELAEAEMTGNSNAAKQALDQLVDQLAYNGYTIGLDLPICTVYKELAFQYYPNAKVLLSVRDDNVDRWAKSFLEIHQRIHMSTLRKPWKWIPPFSYMAKLEEWLLTKRLGVPRNEVYLDEIRAGTRSPTEPMSLNTTKALYHRYVEDVKETIPEDRLVVYSVKQGWGPLCEHFLLPGHNCPTEDQFPRTNRGGFGWAKINGAGLAMVSDLWPDNIVGFLVGLLLVVLVLPNLYYAKHRKVSKTKKTI